MASARKKQDEKHLKILRELVSNPQNRQCFDCHQRGPTYVNMTIGSFVCTSCSGLLRGLTPPHRVKSISMATFSPEEIELISSRGNEYCRRIWLGLHEPGRVTDTRDEQGIKDFMTAKYEKKRYYLDPSMANMNGLTQSSPALGSTQRAASATTSAQSSPSPSVASGASGTPPVRPLASLVPSFTLPAISSISQTPSKNQSAFTPDGTPPGFLVDFSNSSLSTVAAAANPAPTSVSNVDPFGMPTSTSAAATSTSSDFANFDNNPIFDASNEPDLFGSLPLSGFGSASVQPSAFSALSFNGDALNFSSKFNPNRWSMPPSNALPTSQSFPGVGRKSSSGGGSAFQPPPAEDRYAALKDLDSLMKSQQPESSPPPTANTSQSDWTSTQGSSNWAAFGVSPQPQPSAFPSSFPAAAGGGSGSTSSYSNPFTGSNPWSAADSVGVNPFRSGQASQPAQSSVPFSWNAGGAVGSVGVNGTGTSMNGFHAAPTPLTFPSSQSLHFPTKAWNTEPAGNPFMLGSSSTSGTHSSNPFL